MATKSTKTTPSVKNTETSNATVNNRDQNNQQSDKQSQFATILVGLLIIASGLLIYNYFQRTSAPETTSQTEQQQEQANNQDQESQEESNGETAGDTDQEPNGAKEGEYTVMPGDSLWSIAEKAYGDGHQWKKIADANEIQNNTYGQPTVEIGQVLNVPDSAAVAEKPQEEKPATPSTDKQVAGIQEVQQTPSTAIQTYTVQTGDTLWSIAEQVYGDGHRWVDIFNDPHNDLGTLDGRPLVHAGNTLYLPHLE